MYELLTIVEHDFKYKLREHPFDTIVYMLLSLHLSHFMFFYPRNLSYRYYRYVKFTCKLKSNLFISIDSGVILLYM